MTPIVLNALAHSAYQNSIQGPKIRKQITKTTAGSDQRYYYIYKLNSHTVITGIEPKVLQG